MQLVTINSTGIAQALSVLENGGVVAHATETCYGLACDMRNVDAVAKLFAIKQRPPTQPVSALFTSVEQAKEYVEWNDAAQTLADQHLPGPLTLILPLRADAPYQLFPVAQRRTSNAERSTIGTRVSSHPLAQELVKQFGSPISTTSANIHGLPNPYAATAILEAFKTQEHQPDLVLDSGELPAVPPSTVMDLTTESGAVRRQGAV